MDRNGMDRTEAEDIKNRWHRRTIKKKNLHVPDNHNGGNGHKGKEYQWSLKFVKLHIC